MSLISSEKGFGALGRAEIPKERYQLASVLIKHQSPPTDSTVRLLVYTEDASSFASLRIAEDSLGHATITTNPSANGRATLLDQPYTKSYNHTIQHNKRTRS